NPVLRSTDSFPYSPHISNAKNPDGAGLRLYRGQLFICHGRRCRSVMADDVVPRVFGQKEGGHPPQRHQTAPKLSNHLRMQPPVLNPFFPSLTSLPGVGPKLDKLYAHLLDRESPRVVDLLFYLPSGAIDRRSRPKLRDAYPGQVVTVAITVDKHRPSPPRRSR